MTDPNSYYSSSYVTSRYGPRAGAFHAGDDYAHPPNAAVPAITDGTVIAAGPDPYGKLGNRVTIERGGVHITYGHLADRVNVRVGQQVSAGSIVGLVGDPQNASVLGEWDGPHTHLGTTVGGQPMDPSYVLANLPRFTTVRKGPEGGSPTEQKAVAQAAVVSAKKYNVPQGVLLGTLHVENDLNMEGGNGGGPGQVIPSTAAMYGVTQEQLRTDPQLATDVSAHILADNYKQFGDWEKAVGAYFAGPLNIANAGNNYRAVTPPGNQGTVGQYIDKVKNANAIATSFLTGDNQATTGVGPTVVGSGPHVGGVVGGVTDVVTAVPNAATSIAGTFADFLKLITNSRLWWTGGFIVVGGVFVLVGGVLYLTSFREVQNIERTAVTDAAIA